MAKKKKIDLIERKCLYVAEDGKGVVSYKRGRLHVPYLLEGEKAKIQVFKKSDPEILEFLEESDKATEPECEYYYECGGCHIQHMTKEAQLEFKEDTVRRFLGRYGKINKIIAMDNPYDYRNKVHSTFATTKDGEIVSGLYKESTHSIIPIERCIIQDPKADEILNSIRQIFKKYKMRTYNEYTDKGFLRHVLIRTGHESKEVMVVFVVAHNKFYSKNKILKELKSKHPEIKTIIMNINDKDTSVVLGDKEKVLYGNGKIQDTLSGLKFNISSKSFFQVNPIQTEKLYHKALEFAELKEDDIIIDTYCGIGTIGLLAAQKVKQAYGIEVNPIAVKNAISNANMNNIDNIRFIEADASNYMKEVAKGNDEVDVVFMDPPRSGSDEIFLSSLAELSPRKIVYISCNPKTQARDLKLLTKYGYYVEEIQPVDMFPQTYHIENIVKLVKLK